MPRNGAASQHRGLSQGNLQVAVAGGAVCSDTEKDLARSVGHGLAQAGVTLVCGGRTGVMQFAAEGAKSAGGLTVGILPNESRQDANPFVDVAVATGMGQARNLAVVLSSDALIAIGGEFGTLSEVALALKHGIPVIALNSWRLDKISDTVLTSFHVASTADEAVTQAILLARQGRLTSKAIE